MLKEFHLFDVYLAPLAPYLAISALVWLVLRWVFQKAGFYRYIWHPPLFNTALYVILLSATFYYLN